MPIIPREPPYLKLTPEEAKRKAHLKFKLYRVDQIHLRLKGKVCSPKGLEKIKKVAERVPRVKGVSLGYIDGELRLLPTRDFLTAKEWGRQVVIIMSASSVRELVWRIMNYEKLLGIIPLRHQPKIPVRKFYI